jgi:hypothetical protein
MIISMREALIKLISGIVPDGLNDLLNSKFKGVLSGESKKGQSNRSEIESVIRKGL